MSTALIIGVSGQDGSYLAKLLLSKGYSVVGTSRDHEVNPFTNLTKLGILERVTLTSLDTSDFRSVISAIKSFSPVEIYNLAGQTSVGLSFSYPVETFNSILLGTMNLLECLRILDRPIKYYNAGSGEVYGNSLKPSSEDSPFSPVSPYGTAKAAASYMVSNYRQSYGMFCCTGILFNHESPLRPRRFVTKKITDAVRRILSGSKEAIELGKTSIIRDWGWAPDYVEAMWKMLNQPNAEDFIIASGRSHSLEDFLRISFGIAGLDWVDHVVFSGNYLRPIDITSSYANPSKAKHILQWTSTLPFDEMVRKLVHEELY